MAKPLTGKQSLDELTTSVRRAAALKAALELEVFARIDEGNRSLPAFCRATGLEERPARLLLDALSSVGYLVRTEFEYMLSPTAETFLVKGKPDYFGDVLLEQFAWDARGGTAKAVKNNKPSSAWAEEHQGARAPQTWYDPETAREEFAPIWEELPIEAQANAVLRVLALGVEAGLRTLPLLQKFSRAKLWVLDQAGQLERLRAQVETLQLHKRVEYLEGEWLTPLDANTFDVAVVDTITETHTIEENIGILHHAYEALKMGGWIVVRAAMEEDDRKGPGLVPLWALDLQLATASADVYTRTEYRGMLEAAGFFEIKPVGERLNIWTARVLPPPPLAPPVDTLAPDFIPAPEVYS